MVRNKKLELTQAEVTGRLNILSRVKYCWGLSEWNEKLKENILSLKQDIEKTQNSLNDILNMFVPKEH